jgi:hypothetical protein
MIYPEKKMDKGVHQKNLKDFDLKDLRESIGYVS